MNLIKKQIIKYYYYTERGLDLVNVFRNLLLGIGALWVAMHFVSLWWAVLMFIIAMPILTLLGFLNVHHISKVRDRLNVKFGTHYGIKQYDYTKRTCELLEEINKKLK